MYSHLTQSEIQIIKKKLDVKLKDAGIIIALEEQLKSSVRSNKGSVNKDIPIDMEVQAPATQPQSVTQRDPSTPASLTEQELKEYSHAIRIFGERTIACILSPYFNLRESGMREAIEAINNNQNSDSEEVLRAVFQLILFISTDIREKSNTLYVELFQSTIDYAERNQISIAFLVPLIAQSFPTLLNKTAELNPRIRQKSMELIQFLAEKYHSGPVSVLPLFIRPIGSKVSSIPAKHAKTRLELTNQMMNDYGFPENEGHSSHSWNATVYSIDVECD
jgi:hypothetical protein